MHPAGRARRDELPHHRPRPRPTTSPTSGSAAPSPWPSTETSSSTPCPPGSGPGQRSVLTGPAGLPGGQRPGDGAGPGDCGVDDRGVGGRDRQAGHLKLGRTPTRITEETSELLLGWWSEIGVDAEEVVVPQDQYINLALFGTPEFEMFQWRQHAGVGVDQQYFWWHSAGSHPDGELSLNFMRLNDPMIDAALDTARSSLDEAERTAAAEEINRTFAEKCYAIPLSWTLWGVLSDPKVKGFGTLECRTGPLALTAPASAASTGPIPCSSTKGDRSGLVGDAAPTSPRRSQEQPRAIHTATTRPVPDRLLHRHVRRDGAAAPGPRQPGRPGAHHARRHGAPEAIAETNEKYHLNSNYLVQYWFWLKGMLTGDFGYSVQNNLPVARPDQEPHHDDAVPRGLRDGDRCRHRRPHRPCTRPTGGTASSTRQRVGSASCSSRSRSSCWRCS